MLTRAGVPVSVLAAKLMALALLLAPTLPTARAESVAISTAAAAEGDLEEATLLLVTNFRESSFRAEIEDCHVLGDGGRAFTAYQLHASHFGGLAPERLCRDPELAARRALRALGAGPAADRVARYMGRSRGDPEVRLRVALYIRLLAATES